MSAAAERAALAAIAGDLLAVRGDAGERRAAGLLARSDEAPARDFADLMGAPAWLRRPREAQTRLAQAMALRSIAPALAGSIDGGWLGALADVAGEDAVDWAIAKGADAPRAGDAPVAADTLTVHGFAMLRGALPEGLRCNLSWAPQSAPVAEDAAALENALAFVGPSAT